MLYQSLCTCPACATATVRPAPLSRRRVLAGLGALAGGVTLGGAQAAAQAVLGQPVQASRAVDLTQTIGGRLPTFPGNVPFTMTPGARYEHGYRTDAFEFGDSSTGTNLDAPAHFFAGAPTIEQVAASTLVAPAVVVDIREHVARQADYGVSAADLAAWEATHGPILEGAFVMALAGWSERFHDPERFFNADTDGVMRFPGFLPEAAELLLARRVAGAGVEAISADVGSTTTYGFHAAMLGAGAYLIEGLTNLSLLPPTGASVVSGVLPIEGAAQAPARVMALLG